MTRRELRSTLEADYETLLNVLTRTAKYLEGLNVDADVLKSYKHLLRFLRSRPATSIPEIIGGATARKYHVTDKHVAELSDQEILSMSSEGILGLAANREVPRRTLERVATVRFGMTRGGISTLRNREAFVEKLRTLIANEGTHESITRAAAQQSTAR